MWVFYHEYGPSSPEPVYKSPPCQGDKFCLPLKNQQLSHFPLPRRHCGPIILCDYAVPCIGDNVQRVNMAYRLSSLAGVGLDKLRPILPYRSLRQVPPLLAKLGAGCVCLCVCVWKFEWRSELYQHCLENGYYHPWKTDLVVRLCKISPHNVQTHGHYGRMFVRQYSM